MENYISLFNWYKILSFKRKLHYLSFSGKEIKKYKLKKKKGKEKAEKRLVQIACNLDFLYHCKSKSYLVIIY